VEVEDATSRISQDETICGERLATIDHSHVAIAKTSRPSPLGGDVFLETGVLVLNTDTGGVEGRYSTSGEPLDILAIPLDE
jgi:hypothetical protein